jgi:nitroimidazol reductase NimA-like FMN-containing flavoprotein (pyridoxamine 5'-phosphate oxidase superfamily)
MDGSPVAILDEAECWSRLSQEQVGRLALAISHRVDIFPINYVVHRGAIYFRTAPGSKLLELAANPDVAFEIDRFDEHTAFSVVVRGTAERLELGSEIEEAELSGLITWIPTVKDRWVRILPTEVSGREFTRGPEPEPDYLA